MSSQDELDLNAPYNYSDGADGVKRLSRSQDDNDYGPQTTSPLRPDSDEDSIDLLAPQNYSDGADGVVFISRDQEDGEGAALASVERRDLSGLDDELEVEQFEHSSNFDQPCPRHDFGARNIQQRVLESDNESNDGAGYDCGSEDGVEAISAPSDAESDGGSEDGGRESTPPRCLQHTDGLPTAEDTPAGQHTTSSRLYQMGNLGEMRQAVTDHVGAHALELPFDEFAERFLPPLSYAYNIRNIVRKLIEDELVDCPRMVLKDFATEPTSSEKREEDVFAPLAMIFQNICCLASRMGSNIPTEYFLGMLPNHEPYSEVSMKHRPDGSLLPNSKREFVDKATCVKGEMEADKKKRLKEKQELEEQGKQVTFHDILVPLEVKKHLSDREDNVSKMIFHGQQLIAHDPRRRFVIGITIENTEMRLWFFSRTTPVVSKVICFTMEIERLIHVVLSLFFASAESLGLDPTIQLVPDGNDHHYVIEVDNRKYRTIKVIADVKAHALISTAVRVWEVIENDSGDLSPDSLILKDTWIEADRDLERDIHKKILRDVWRKYGEPVRKRVANGLLTPIADWSVVIDEEYDCTRDAHSETSATKFFSLKKENKRRVTITPGCRGSGPPGSHTLGNRSVDRTKIQSHPRRKHYRVVFAEVGSPLYSVKKLSHAFRVLKDSAGSLKYIHGCGWVHRDISSSNLYFYQDRGLVGDLEYARRTDSRSIAHKIRTASFDCMAIEAIARSYAFIDQEQTPARPPFIYNELHDLESLWWTAMFMLFFILDIGFDEGLSNKGLQVRSQKREEVRQELFPGTRVVEKRQNFLIEKDTFRKGLSWVPDTLHGMNGALNMARASLVQSYKTFEREGKFQELDFTEAHEDLISSFEICEEIAARVEEEVGCSLVQEFFSTPAVPTTETEPVMDDEEDSDEDQDLPTESMDDLSGQGRKSQKRKRSPAVDPGSSRPRYEQTDDPEFV